MSSWLAWQWCAVNEQMGINVILIKVTYVENATELNKSHILFFLLSPKGFLDSIIEIVLTYHTIYLFNVYTSIFFTPLQGCAAINYNQF